jgi:hypothetical protein
MGDGSSRNGSLVILIRFGIAVFWLYDNAADAGAVLATVTGTAGSIVGAYFGVQLGSAGKEEADEQANQMRAELSREKDKSQMLASACPIKRLDRSSRASDS